MKSGRIPARTENVSRIWLLGLALMMIGVGGSNVFAMDLLGPPTAGLEKGMFRGGLEYSFSSMDLDLMEGSALVYRNGELQFSGIASSLTIKDFEVNTLYAAVGYGVFENFEAFLRMGAAKATFGDSLWGEGEEFDSNIDLAIGCGVKATFYEGFDWKIGAIFQINRSELDGEIDSSAWTTPQPNFVEISTTEMQIAMGAMYMYSRRLSIYGGPFAHFISGNFDYDFNRVVENVDTGTFSWKINEGPTFGAYLGAQLEIAKNVSGNIEYQQISDGNVFGASVMMRY
jgi:hypothetical protein